ncbi:MAG: methyltransferase domain-containing protein [Acetobacteraceae bacterium]
MSTSPNLAWDPALYLRFGSQRLRPALDLLARIPIEAPARIIDLGCGAGNVTALLCRRWPRAAVLGIDSSGPMLDHARHAAPGLPFGSPGTPLRERNGVPANGDPSEARFERADIAQFVPPEPPALLYSNAALQWLPDHPRLLPRLLSFLAPGGFLAVQMPAMDAAPFRALQREVAMGGPWAAALAEVPHVHSVLPPDQYWDLLKPRSASLDIWETIYLHALTGPDAVLQWAMGTSLRPYLDALDEPERSSFRDAYAAALRPHYPQRPDGTTLLPFRRLFLLAKAPE